jgi:protein-L-isoaspartate(D-aspartate) O-methyltransferase
MPDQQTIAHKNMVNQQVRCWGVLETRVLNALGKVPRERFVPPAYRALAFADTNLPLRSSDRPGDCWTMMRPLVEGRLLQALEIAGHETVLEIGTGSGFLTACLANLAQHVTSIDISEIRLASAKETLASLGIKNSELLIQDVFQRTESLEYDAIAVTGSLPEYDPRFEKWLKLGGRAFMIVGELPIMEAVLIRRVGIDEWTRDSLFETVLPPLVQAPGHEAFTF